MEEATTVQPQAPEQANAQDGSTIASAPRHHTKPQKPRDRFFKLRQVFNLLFMVLGVIGAVMYSGFVGTGVIEQMGAVIAVIAISLKMAECILRYIK